ncbi:unnamed protein product [Enterobius vermicularis]|uniref:RRM domain-containing protein n=1 Tax=Enterobius vermicularis TaxID=51028 RepID=A0A0N4UX19_ENTVE|nr:unnamed protein product [Enterobius vermicularis]
MGEFQKAPEGYEAVNGGPDAFGVVYRSVTPGKPAIWCGELPIHNYVNPIFSRKVFVGGIPWDANENDLVTAFNKFGTCRVEWPIKEMRVSHLQLYGTRRPKAFGYVYIVYNDGSSIRKLLQECKQELGSAGEWYFKISTRRTHSATEVRQAVQVIPWVVSDISCIPDTVSSPDPKKTVFVGGVHGMVTSQMLFSIMNEIFGSVALVELDNDKYQYPLGNFNFTAGSGRVTFLSSTSFYRAVEDGFFEIRTSKFSKRVQVDPYIQLSKCSQCSLTIGPYFCRERICFNYYCARCWQVTLLLMIRHKSLRAQFEEEESGEVNYWLFYSPTKHSGFVQRRLPSGRVILSFVNKVLGSYENPFALTYKNVRHALKGPYSNHKPLERHSRRPICMASDNNNNTSQLGNSWSSPHSIPLSYVGSKRVGPMFSNGIGFMSRAIERNAFFISAEVGGVYWSWLTLLLREGDFAALMAI